MSQTGRALVGLLLWAACTNDADAPTPAPGTGSECATPEVCDIADAECLRQLLVLTACERGDAEPPPVPETRSVSRAQVEAELRRDAEADGGELSPWDVGLARLRLLPEASSVREVSLTVTAEGIAAYFDPDTKLVTIIDDAADDELSRMEVLSHELTHYLQDRELGLTELLESAHSSDEQAAVRALIEGEAVVNSARVLTRLLHYGPEDVAWSRLFASFDEKVLASIEDSTAPLHTAVLSFPYSAGARYVGEVWIGYDRQHLDALYAQAPSTLVDWLSGYGAGMPKASLLEPLACAPPQVIEGFELVDLDSFGPTGLLALLAAADKPDLATVASLRADAVAVYVRRGAESDASASVLVWRMRFASEAGARAVAARLPWTDVGQRMFGRELVLTAGADVTQSALSGAVETCPQLDELRPMRSSMPVAAVRPRPGRSHAERSISPDTR